MEFKVTSINATPAQRTRSGRLEKCVIYFFPKGESVIENLVNRRTRPFNEYRKMLPEVLRVLGFDAEAVGKLRWSQKAGCGCGCSPGFIIENRYAVNNQNIFVDFTSKE